MPRRNYKPAKRRPTAQPQDTSEPLPDDTDQMAYRLVYMGLAGRGILDAPPAAKRTRRDTRS